MPLYITQLMQLCHPPVSLLGRCEEVRTRETDESLLLKNIDVPRAPLRDNDDMKLGAGAHVCLCRQVSVAVDRL